MGKKNHEMGNNTVRNYKDTVFRMLFNDKTELLALYNAVNHTDYKDSEVLQIATLESAIYMCMKNDVSFVMDTTLNLYEQQSTVNPNMPLRHLLYVAKQFEELLIGKDLYSRKPIILPEPRFVTLRSTMAPKSNLRGRRSACRVPMPHIRKRPTWNCGCYRSILIRVTTKRSKTIAQPSANTSSLWIVFEPMQKRCHFRRR